MRMIFNVTSSTEVPHVVNLRSPSWCPRTLPSGCPHNIILAHQTLHAYKQPIRHRYSMERTNYLRGAQLKNGKPTSTYCLPLRYSSVHPYCESKASINYFLPPPRRPWLLPGYSCREIALGWYHSHGDLLPPLPGFSCGEIALGWNHSHCDRLPQ